MSLNSEEQHGGNANTFAGAEECIHLLGARIHTGIEMGIIHLLGVLKGDFSKTGDGHGYTLVMLPWFFLQGNTENTKAGGPSRILNWSIRSYAHS